MIALLCPSKSRPAKMRLCVWFVNFTIRPAMPARPRMPTNGQSCDRRFASSRLRAKPDFCVQTVNFETSIVRPARKAGGSKSRLRVLTVNFAQAIDGGVAFLRHDARLRFSVLFVNLSTTLRTGFSRKNAIFCVSLRSAKRVLFVNFTIRNRVRPVRKAGGSKSQLCVLIVNFGHAIGSGGAFLCHPARLRFCVLFVNFAPMRTACFACLSGDHGAVAIHPVSASLVSLSCCDAAAAGLVGANRVAPLAKWGRSAANSLSFSGALS